MPTYTNQRARQSLPTVRAYPAPYVAGFIVSLIIFAGALVIGHQHRLDGLQASIFHWFNNWPDVFRVPALIITEGLGAAYPIALCILLALAFKRFRLAWRFVVTVGGAGVLMEIAKKIALEPRPVVMLHGNLHLRANEGGLTSFPSGHEAVGTAMALTLWLVLPRRWRWLSVAWIVVLAVSRVYLGVHTPNDVLGGFAIGLLVVCIVRLLPLAIARPLRLDLEKPLLDKGF